MRLSFETQFKIEFFTTVYREYMGVYLDILQVSGVWKHCKYIIFVLRASLSIFISFLSHLTGGRTYGRISS